MNEKMRGDDFHKKDRPFVHGLYSELFASLQPRRELCLWNFGRSAKRIMIYHRGQQAVCICILCPMSDPL